jgi:Na+/melibiose symporter-like transporter
MDIEVSSIVVLLIVNGFILLLLIIYMLFIYKWDKKTYDDLAENLDNYGRE